MNKIGYPMNLFNKLYFNKYDECNVEQDLLNLEKALQKLTLSNILSRNNIISIADLTNKNKEELLNISSLGRRNFKLIEDGLALCNLHLKG